MLIFTKYKFVMIATVLSALFSSPLMAADDPLSSEQVKAMMNRTIGEKLGNGFVVGMTPKQTCANFKVHFKYDRRKENLCKRAHGSGYHNQVIVNAGISSNTDKSQDIGTLAFFFNQNNQLYLVMVVEDADHQDLMKKDFSKKMKRIVDRRQ